MSSLVKKIFLTEKQNDYVVVSTNAKDNEGDIVEQNWILDAFLKNPVMFYSHNYSDFPIGTWEDVRVLEDRLIARPVFANIEGFEEAQLIQKLWDADIIKGASVGFIPLEYEQLEDGGKRYTKNKLIEISITPLPANEDALKLSMSKSIYDIRIENIEKQLNSIEEKINLLYQSFLKRERKENEEYIIIR